MIRDLAISETLASDCLLLRVKPEYQPMIKDWCKKYPTLGNSLITQLEALNNWSAIPYYHVCDLLSACELEFHEFWSIWVPND